MLLLQEPHDGADEFLRACRLFEMNALATRLAHMLIAAVKHERDVAGIEKGANFASVAVAQSKIENGGREIGMAGKRQGITNASCAEDGGAGPAQRLHDIQRDERFILEDEDHMPGKDGIVHGCYPQHALRESAAGHSAASNRPAPTRKP